MHRDRNDRTDRRSRAEWKQSDGTWSSKRRLRLGPRWEASGESDEGRHSAGGSGVRDVRVLQVHVAYRQHGGEDAVVAAEAELLTQGGHEVAGVHARNPSGPLGAATSLAASSWNRRAAERTRSIVRSFRPDVAHVHNTWFALSASAIHALREERVPVVMTLHNYRPHCIDGTLFRDGKLCHDCFHRAPIPGIVHRCYRGSAALSTVAALALTTARRRGVWSDDVDLFIAPTEFARRLHVDGGLPADRITVKPHFRSDPGARANPPSHSDVVVAAGRLAPGKGFAHMLDAWRLAPPGLRLEIFGDGPLRADLEAVAPPGVSFRGRVGPDEVLRRFGEARALLFTSELPETFGMVLIEAMASGLAIAGTDPGTSHELVQPVRSDLFAPPADTSGLAAALELLSDDDLVDRAGEAARRRYEQTFTPAVNLPLLEEAYAVACSR
jgi:glycosyltransferase involved in cell wall biosynthesis